MEKTKANMEDVSRLRACQDWGRMEVGRGLFFLGVASWHGSSARLDVLVGLRLRGKMGSTHQGGWGNGSPGNGERVLQ